MHSNKKRGPIRTALRQTKRFIFASAPVQYFIAFVVALPIWVIYFTCRVRVENYDIFKKYRRAPAVFLFWHGRAMMLSPVVCLGGMRSYVMASRHADGRLMARIQRMFGLRAVYGSSSEGAVSVLRESVRALNRGGYSMCIPTDGPSGPSMRVKSGALYIAKMTGAPIIPVTFSASRARFLARWDRFLVAMPFSRVLVRVGAPVFVPRDVSDDEFERIRKHIEDVMVGQVRDLDGKFGLPMVEQDFKSSEFKRQRRAARMGK